MVNEFLNDNEGMGKDQKKRMIIGIGLFLALVVLGVFFVKPSLTGYVVHDDVQEENVERVSELELNMDNMRSQVEIASATLDSCHDFNEKIIGEIEKISDKIVKCEKDKQFSEENFQNLVEETDKQYNRMNSELSDALDGLGELKDSYTLVVQNAADNICCKKHVDDSRISAYEVRGNKIVCLEEGGTALNCP